MCAAITIPGCIRSFLYDLHKPGDVYACYRVYFLLGICGGIVPFQFHPLPIRHLKTTLFGYINCIIRIIFYASIFIISIIREQSLLAYFYETKISRYTDGFQKVNGLFGTIIVLVLGLFDSQSLITLMHFYEWLELLYSRIGIRILQKNCAFQINLRIAIMLCTNFSFLLYGRLFIFEDDSIFVSWLALSTFYSPYLIISCVVVLYTTTLFKISIYLKILNAVIIKNIIKLLFSL